MSVDLLTIDEVAPLPGPGLIAGDELLSSDPALAKAFAAATLLAQQAIAADRQVGLEAALAAVPAIAEDRETGLAVLEATVDLWGGGPGALSGFIDPAVWGPGYAALQRLGFIDGSVPPGDMVLDVLAMPT
jgi:hypothetical protein